MKVCFPTQTNEGLAAAVYGHFGSAPFFTLCDTQDGAAAAPDVVSRIEAAFTARPHRPKNSAVRAGGER